MRSPLVDSKYARMHLDGPTLLVAGTFVTAVSGILLLAAWTQIRTSALLFWAAASFANAIGMALIVVSFQTGFLASTPVSDLLNATATVLVWMGARNFNQRPQLPWVIAAILAVMLVARVVIGDIDLALASAALFVTNIVFLTAAAWEISRQRPDPLGARWPLAAFIFLHAAVFATGVFDAFNGSLSATLSEPMTNWFSIIHIETAVYALGTTVFMVLLCKQRSEGFHIEAARQDPLTGIINRGAFLDCAERIVERHRRDAVPVSLVMFDLDRFKSINDTFGHAVGDEAIRIFTQTTIRVLRPTDLFGRYGGEEFALVLPGATLEVASAVAERIRHNFALAAAIIDDHVVEATISGGIAVANSEDDTIEVLLRRADHQLYRAKDLGRNRICHATPHATHGRYSTRDVA